ncbi:beta strand repeat-containing protein [Caulobacter soli]|uniref:beta strand repeat-containing protein n=1 Tax=Caulobacter soli TaxID=2708539 RepID=UPI0013EE3B56|nr:hypothetical protein [Caulobacter soli]
MTPSTIRTILPRPLSRAAHRNRLLAASALVSVLALAQPSVAGTLPGIPSAANITVSTGGSQPFITFPDAITLQIDLNAPRTVINWTDLHLSSGDAMNFLFDAANDIVLNKTTSQIRFDNGSVVTGKIGAATAGNVWFYSPQGVIVSPGATMTAGGFLFSKGSGLNDASFAATTANTTAALTNLRAATDALIQMTTISSATTASINSSGDVVLSASSGPLNVSIAAGATVDISTTSGSITASEVTATSGAASVAAGGPGATVAQITGETGVTVSSGANTSVGSATTMTSGDILLTSNGSASLTLGNSARDLTLSAPLVFAHTVDAVRDVFLTGTTGASVANRIFAGDDIEITASNGDVDASGAILRSTGLGASDDAHILLRSDTGSVTADTTLLTQGTGAQAGDITVQAATDAIVGTADSTRDLKITGTSASLDNGSAARDLFVTATTGNATVTTSATAGDDVEVTTTDGDLLASGATLKSTGVGATDDAHVLAKSTNGAADVGTAITQGTGVAAGDVTLDSGDTITAGDLQSTRDVLVTAAGDVDVTAATAGRDITITSNGGGAILRKAVLTGAGVGHDLSITATNDAVLGDPDYQAITTANLFSRTGGNTGAASVRSTGGGDAVVHLDTADLIDTLEGEGVDVTISNGLASFGTITANTTNIYVEALNGGLTVDTATANNGDVALYDAGGDLTLTGSAHGANLVHLETDGLLDGKLASLISSDGDLELIGGGVDVGHITANGMIEATAATANAVVQWAEAGQAVVVASINGDATLRGATGPDGVAVVAYNTATFGADDLGSINPDNYVDTNVSCGCGTDGLQVTSFNGNAVVNINVATNGIDLVASSIGGDVTVNQTSGDLKINEVAGYNISLNANDGALEVGHVTSSGGDYTIRGQDFLGAVLTPDLFSGAIHDVTITDTLGDLDLGTAAIHADHWLTITAEQGAVTGAAQLSAGGGLNDARVVVTGQSVALDTVTSDGLVTLDGRNGLVDVATSVDVWGNYSLSGGDFANAALTPQGDMRGTWAIRDRVGGFDFTGKTLHYGGSLLLFVNGVVNGGDITVDVGNIYAEVYSGHLGALTAPLFVGATSIDGGIDVDLIRAGTVARVWATDFGTARLGGAIMSGTATPQVLVEAFDGDAILGAATPGAITTANAVTSTGAPATISVTAPTGRVDINLDHITNAGLTSVDGLQDVIANIANGPLTIDGTVHGGNTVRVASHGGMTIAGTGKVQADGAGDAVILASDGVFTNARGADAVAAPNGRWLIYSQAVGNPLGSTAGDSFNGLAGVRYFGSRYDFSTGLFSTTPGAGNRFVQAYRAALTVTADALSKQVGQAGDPPLTYRITAGTLFGGDAFTGSLAREAGELPGDYAIGRGTLGLAANYDLTFTGAVFTIKAVPSNDQNGSAALKSLGQSPDFTLDWDPEFRLTTEGQACSGEGCPPQAAIGGGKAVAALR